MFRIAAKLSSRASSTALVALTAKPSSPISGTRPSLLAASRFKSFYPGLEFDPSMADPVLSDSPGYLWLKQCLATELAEGNGPQLENSKGIALLSMSTLLSERGDYGDAFEKLESVQELTNSYLGVRVASFEAQAGLHLELGQDDMASAVADKCVELVEKQKTGDFEALNVRAKALKGLIELVNGNVDSAEAFFHKSLRDKPWNGPAAMSYGEFLLAKQDYATAKVVYQNVIQGATEILNRGNLYLGAGNMSFWGLLMGAVCALGQLESHLGNFDDAGQHLTKALHLAEKIYGERHPKMGVVLTCVALMERHKAIKDYTDSVLIQEGLYRRVTAILKVPPVETESEGAVPLVDRCDIAALARGAYAEVLGAQENRKDEGEKMNNLAEAIWRNRRMSLDDALGNTELAYVIDARISRLL